MITAITALGSLLLNGVTGYFKGKQKIKAAIVENKIRLAQSAFEANQNWEMKQLDNVGWKDEVLFYSVIGMFIWAGFDPEGSRTFFVNLQVLPDWFVKIFLWIVASIVGVKKIGEYLPATIKGVKEAFKK